MITGARRLTVLVAVAVAVAMAVLSQVAASGDHEAGAPVPPLVSTSTADSVEIAAIAYVPDATDGSLVSHVDVELAGTLQPRTQVDLRLSSSGSWYRCSPAGTASSGATRTSLRCIPDDEMTSSSRIRQVTVMLSAS